MIEPLVLAAALLCGAAHDYDLIDTPPIITAATPAKAKEAPKPPGHSITVISPIKLDTKAFSDKPFKWPRVCLNILGFKGCTPCAQMKKDIDQVIKEGNTIYYWDIDQHPDLPKVFKVKYGYPHLAMTITGTVVEQHDGQLNACAMRNWFTHVEEVIEGTSKFDKSVRYTKGVLLPRPGEAN